MKRRIRVTLGAWMVTVAVVCVCLAVAVLAIRERRHDEARIQCERNLSMLMFEIINETSFYIVPGKPDGAWFCGDQLPSYVTESSCPLAVGTNATFRNSYSLGDGVRSNCNVPSCAGGADHNMYYISLPVTTPGMVAVECLICPDEHTLRPRPRPAAQYSGDTNAIILRVIDSDATTNWTTNSP